MISMTKRNEMKQVIFEGEKDENENDDADDYYYVN